MSARPEDPLNRSETRVRVRRTRLLSRPADQFRTSLVPTLASALMLVGLLALVHSFNERSTNELAAAHPAARELLEAQGADLETALAFGSIFYLVGILAVGLIHSRRMMGALFAMHRRIRRLGEGDLLTPIHLRRGDYFHDVADSINETLSSLRSQAREDLADTGDLIAILDRSPYAGPLRDGLREGLQAMRARKRAQLGIEEPQEREPAGTPIVAFPR